MEADKTAADTVTPGVRKPELNWRFDFSGYAETRRFLDQLADLSKREDYYPNVSFGKTYVNVSVDADGQTILGVRAARFFEEMKAYATRD